MEKSPFVYPGKTGSNTLSYVTMRVTERANMPSTKDRRSGRVDYLPKVDDFNNYLLNSEVGAEAAMNTRLSFGSSRKINSTASGGWTEGKRHYVVSALVFKY